MLDYTAPKTDREYYAGRRYISLNDVTAGVTGPPGLRSLEYSDYMGSLDLWGLGQPMQDYDVSLPFEEVRRCCDNYKCQDEPGAVMCEGYDKCYMPGDGKQGKPGYDRACDEEDGAAVMTFSRPMSELKWEMVVLGLMVAAIIAIVLARTLRAK